MTLSEFKTSLTNPLPPDEVHFLLEALWYDAQGDWQTAHKLAQTDSSIEAAWVHAFLHRKEGDLTNARYWYAQANKSLPDASLEYEWDEIARHLIASIQ